MITEQTSVSMKKPVISRSVSARLVERFIFNYRLAPDALAARLPARWLRPQVINGYSVVSFCILKLDRLMLSPLQPIFGFDTISCAFRCGVIDCSKSTPRPSVYIVGRNTDLEVISRLGPYIFKSNLPKVHTELNHIGDMIDVEARFNDGQSLFSAKVKSSRTPSVTRSKVFDSLDAFVKFIHDGSSSYAPSADGNCFSRVDLFKEDSNYEAMDALIDYSWLDSHWQDSGLIFDSTFRAGGGGRYKWVYLGLYSQKEPWSPLETPSALVKMINK